MKDNFSKQANLYANFRPHYPDALYKYIFEQVKNFDVALDVATGNGQAASVLANRFKKVFGTDISLKQLDNAIQKENIEYLVEPAEKFSFPDLHFDLITVAQAIHWFDFEKFYAEVNRTLKSNGLLVVIGYGLIRIDDELNAIIDHFYKNIIGPYWDKERKLIDEEYQTIPFPFTEIESPKLFIEYEWTLEHFLNYLQTWSAVQHYITANNHNPVSNEMIMQLKQYWSDEELKKICFPLFIRAGRKV